MRLTWSWCRGASGQVLVTENGIGKWGGMCLNWNGVQLVCGGVRN